MVSYSPHMSMTTLWRAYVARSTSVTAATSPKNHPVLLKVMTDARLLTRNCDSTFGFFIPFLSLVTFSFSKFVRNGMF